MRRLNNARASAVAAWRAIAKQIDRRDLLLIGGLPMLGIGAEQAWHPLGLIVPGAVLTAIAIFGVRE